MQLFSDATVISASFTSNCKIDKLITSLNGLISVEGLSTFSTRGGVSLLTLGPQFWDAWTDEKGTGFTIGEKFGKLFSGITNFTI